MSVCCEYCLLSGRDLSDRLITRPEESYHLWCVVVCHQETSKTRRLKAGTGLWKIQPQWVVTPGKQTKQQQTFLHSLHLRWIINCHKSFNLAYYLISIEGYYASQLFCTKPGISFDLSSAYPHTLWSVYGQSGRPFFLPVQ